MFVRPYCGIKHCIFFTNITAAKHTYNICVHYNSTQLMFLRVFELMFLKHAYSTHLFHYLQILDLSSCLMMKIL